ncbi:hypothetical protein L202_03515 [Cryptococcus amylolentus CBS 6039]|uniref:Uncharacterized protein n=1 Tax=Cryptococcus amylolentus CBS 6039 TaxID=1295533 RepID=A0A1E3HVH9_9TREE|nr:hypothetical protein L202_03515 [Cryptococcus amylolentus CBS 6039]ODN79561.1 hypothetical protein L202_03515 [Cryptococcus amylolentus CBS 6039]
MSFSLRGRGTCGHLHMILPCLVANMNREMWIKRAQLDEKHLKKSASPSTKKGSESFACSIRSSLAMRSSLPREHAIVFRTVQSLTFCSVVFVITDRALTPLLNPDEVSRLFSMPLASFLHTRPSQIPSFAYSISPRLATLPPGAIDSIPPPPPIHYAEDEGTVGGKEGRYYGWRDVKWGAGLVRMHRFLTGRESEGVKPVYGLTAAILIRAASVGYGVDPEFAVYAPGQSSMDDRIEYEIQHGNGALRRAIESEGLSMDWIISAKL